MLTITEIHHRRFLLALVALFVISIAIVQQKTWQRLVASKGLSVTIAFRSHRRGAWGRQGCNALAANPIITLGCMPLKDRFPLLFARGDLSTGESIGEHWERPGHNAPIVRPIIASDDQPLGLRTLQIPPKLASEALVELEERGLKSATQWETELGNSFYSSRNGRYKKKPGPEQFPKTFKLMRMTEAAFGIHGHRDELVQVAVRNYVPVGGTAELRPHIDHMMFEEPVLSVVLRCDGVNDGLHLWPARRPEGGEAFAVRETIGTALCLQGPSRYEFVHAVPRVSKRRVSVTWRWFKPEYYQSLLHRAKAISLERTALGAANTSIPPNATEPRRHLSTMIEQAILKLNNRHREDWVQLGHVQKELLTLNQSIESLPCLDSKFKELIKEQVRDCDFKFDGHEWRVSLTSTLDVGRMSLQDASASAREVILHVSRSRCNEWVPLHCVKHDLEAKHGSFEVSRWGFPSFKEFLEHAVGPDHVHVGKHPAVSLVCTVDLVSELA